jgi:nucleoside-diphosphate-sugar epimerase
MESQDNALLVIGARSLIGRRLRERADAWPGTVRFTSRRLIDDQSLILDFGAPEGFDPGMEFATVIVCTPIWLLEDRLLNRLLGLGMKRLVAFSSTSLFTKGNSETDEERDVVQNLAIGEKSMIDFCCRHGVAWTILRPTLIYDEGRDENITRMAATIRKLGFFPVCAPANGLRQPVHARDLAVAALVVAMTRSAENKAYNVPGGEGMTYRAMVEQIFVALDRKPLIVDVPEWAWRLGFAVLDIVQPGKKLKRNIGMATRMNQDLWFDVKPAVEDFGYAPEGFTPDFSGTDSGREASSAL